MTALLSHAPPGYACPFCAIVRGEDNSPWTLASDVVLRTATTTTWVGSRWWANNRGNAIVVPNEHVENMYGLAPELAGDVHETARRLALAMKSSYGCDGVSTRQHNEPAGFQEIWHYHLHVFPRYDGDDLYGSPWRDTTPAERQPYAVKLREAVAAGT
jgi:histidine triad (HIT) family protein